MSDYLKDLEEFKKWYHNNNGDVSSTDCFKFGLQKGCKNTEDKILEMLKTIRFGIQKQKYKNHSDNEFKFNEIINILINKEKELMEKNYEIL